MHVLYKICLKYLSVRACRHHVLLYSILIDYNTPKGGSPSFPLCHALETNILLAKLLCF